MICPACDAGEKFAGEPRVAFLCALLAMLSRGSPNELQDFLLMVKTCLQCRHLFEAGMTDIRASHARVGGEPCACMVCSWQATGEGVSALLMAATGLSETELLTLRDKHMAAHPGDTRKAIEALFDELNQINRDAGRNHILAITSDGPSRTIHYDTSKVGRA